MKNFLFADPLCENLGIYEGRDFVGLWAMHPLQTTRKILVTFLVTWSAKSG